MKNICKDMSQQMRRNDTKKRYLQEIKSSLWEQECSSQIMIFRILDLIDFYSIKG